MTEQGTSTATEDRRSAVDPRVPVYLVTDACGRDRPRRKAREVASGLCPPDCALAVADREQWRRLSVASNATEIAEDIALAASGRVIACLGDDPVRTFSQLHLRRLGMLAPALDYTGIVVDVGRRFDVGSFIAVVQNDARLDLTFRVVQIICATDVGTCLGRPGDRFRRMIGEADTVTLVSDGSSGPAELDVAKARIASLNPFAAMYVPGNPREVLRAPWRVAPGQIDDRSLGHLSRQTGLVRLTGEGEALAAWASNLFNDALCNDAAEAPPNRALRMRLPGAVDLMAVMRVLDDLLATHGGGLHRLCAVLNVRTADHPVVLDVMGGTLLHPGYHARERRTDSDICLVARGLDVARAVEAFRSCAWQHTATEAALSAAI